MQQSAEAVSSLDSHASLELLRLQLWDWLFKVDGAVRAFLVIVGHELAQDALGMVFASN